MRLSIHPSTGAKKFSVSLFPNRGFSMTPWHSSPYFALDGVSQNLHKDFFEQAEDTEIVQKDGRPWMFRQKSELYNWSIDVSFEPVYPCGLLIKSETNTPLTEVDMSKVRKLAELNSPVILRGFADTTDRDLYVKKAHEMGEPTPWKFGLVLEVKDKGSETGGLNNVLSEEPMPMHFDGLFKTAKKIVNGQERLVSQYPRYVHIIPSQSESIPVNMTKMTKVSILHSRNSISKRYGLHAVLIIEGFLPEPTRLYHR